MSEQEKKQNTVAEVLVKCLENEGVKYVFGIPGEENLDMMNALEKSDIRVIVVRHEQGAAFMADMYGRLTGKAGVCFSTLGPGATNLITGTADANSDGAPLIAITGQVGTERMHLTSHQYLDLVELFAPITKRSKQIVNPNSVNEIVRIAFKYAESEKPGACHVDLPTNVAKLPVSSGIAAQPLKKPERDKEYASFSSIDQAAAMIFKAKHPVILVGHSAVRNHAGEALTSFADVLKIPVVNTMMAKGIIPYNNKYSLWTIGIPQKDYQNKVLDMADLVIAVGYDIVEFAPGKWNGEGKHKIIHIDQRPAHINMLYQPEVEVVGDISYSLQQILYRSDAKEEPEEFLKLREEMVAEYESYADATSFPMKPQKILYDVRKFMGADDIVISDVVKPTSQKAIRALRRAGVRRTVMLTGDGAKVADQVASELGIDQVYSQLLPADKVEKIEALLAEKSGKEKLAFVGDGINDAPVLRRADIGIAMGAMGSDAAIEAADVVLMDDDPMQIAKAIRISRKCLGIVYQNITIAIGIKLACLVLIALGLANMWLAVFADVGVMILAVFNAIRALFVKNL